MLSLYRRHRPRTFEDVVGQEHIVRTLRNAIELDKVHHAYLFVGSRGTGKTSMAKLLACALNAEGGPRTDFSPEDPVCVAIALGTLEQLVTYGGKQVKLDDVREVLGVADAELVLDAAEALADHDAGAALMAVEKLSASGRDLTQFMRELAAHLRHLFVVQTLGDVPDSFAVTAEHTDRLQSQAERIPQAEVLRAIELLAAALSAVKDGSDPRIQLEIALLKSAQPKADASVQALMARIERLEQALGGRAPAPAAKEPPRRPERESEPAPPPEPDSTAPAEPPRAAGTPPERAVAHAEAAAAVAASAVADPEPEPESAVAPDFDIDQLKSLWPAVVEAVCEENQMVGAYLAN